MFRNSGLFIPGPLPEHYRGSMQVVTKKKKKLKKSKHKGSDTPATFEDEEREKRREKKHKRHEKDADDRKKKKKEKKKKKNKEDKDSWEFCRQFLPDFLNLHRQQHSFASQNSVKKVVWIFIFWIIKMFN